MSMRQVMCCNLYNCVPYRNDKSMQIDFFIALSAEMDTDHFSGAVSVVQCFQHNLL